MRHHVLRITSEPLALSCSSVRQALGMNEFFGAVRICNWYPCRTFSCAAGSSPSLQTGQIPLGYCNLQKDGVMHTKHSGNLLTGSHLNCTWTKRLTMLCIDNTANPSLTSESQSPGYWGTQQTHCAAPCGKTSSSMSLKILQNILVELNRLIGRFRPCEIGFGIFASFGFHLVQLTIGDILNSSLCILHVQWIIQTPIDSISNHQRNGYSPWANHCNASRLWLDEDQI